MSAAYDAVLEDPGNVLLRGAFADECERMGDMDRATFIRMSLEEDECVGVSPHDGRLIRRRDLQTGPHRPKLALLLTRNGRKWLESAKLRFNIMSESWRPVWCESVWNCCVGDSEVAFRAVRGLFDTAWIRFADWLEHGKDICRALPIVEVNLSAPILTCDTSGRKWGLRHMTEMEHPSRHEFWSIISDIKTGQARWHEGARIWWDTKEHAEDAIQRALLIYGRSAINHDL